MHKASHAKMTILICDDDERLRRSIVRHLHLSDFACIEVATGEEALNVLRENNSISLLILDVLMPGLSGLQVLERLRLDGCHLPVLLLTAHATVDVAVRATKLGCANVLQKPFTVSEITKYIHDAIALYAPATTAVTVNRYDQLLGKSRPMQELFQNLKRLEGFDISTILLSGESGTGKDLVAQAIHRQGRRANRNFIELDCSTVPESLLESTLFGHERGSFTDAHHQRRGLFEMAEDGVIFLDEIGELSPSAQVKLLRALEARTFRRIGGTANLSLSAAVITATNRDLPAEIAAGRFRQDLYYRLSVLQLHTPPLRERADDIPMLATYFLHEFCRRHQRAAKDLSADAIVCLMEYPWPGNIRELRNIMEQMVIFNDASLIQRAHLPPALQTGPKPAQSLGVAFTLPEHGIILQDLERDLVHQALSRAQNNQSHAAKLLGLSRHTFRTLMKRFGML